ncbi:hypothetical protein [Parapedobacter tibetensis]|nr:hypothetical protein [Parapedobacter tibetensis]
MNQQKKTIEFKLIQPIQDRRDDGRLVSKPWKITTVNLFQNIIRSPD